MTEITMAIHRSQRRSGHGGGIIQLTQEDAFVGREKETMPADLGGHRGRRDDDFGAVLDLKWERLDRVFFFVMVYYGFLLGMLNAMLMLRWFTIWFSLG